jgi:hypothetical protein
MCFIDILQYIVMPIISAIIGGLLTFLGVRYTIKHEQIKNDKNEKLLNKPYLKVSYQKGAENVYSDYITDTFDQNKIDFDKTKHFYAYQINTICLMNSSNGDCILKGFIIDDKEYSLGEVLILKNETINLFTTRSTYINTEKQIENIYIRATDVLGNIYYYKCLFKTNYERMPLEVEYENGKRLKTFMINYTITHISLPLNQIKH